MKPGLLIITQKVDAKDETLGFALGWYRRFGRYFSPVTVMCLGGGEYDMPGIEVISLGKEAGAGRLTILLRFLVYSWRRRSLYGRVFIHMNPIYAVIMGLPWRLSGRGVYLWYAHGYVGLKLRLAVLFSTAVFTSTPEGLRIRTPKRLVVGQGIDTDLFRPALGVRTGPFTLVTVGRFTKSKGFELLIRAFASLAKIEDCHLLIAGSPVTEDDRKYLARIKDLIGALSVHDKIEFVGSVRNSKLPDLLHRADLFVNAGLTGSLDKAILEAMAVGLPVLSCNEAVCAMLADRWPAHCAAQDSDDFGRKLTALAAVGRDRLKMIGMEMSEYVRRTHSVDRLIGDIASKMS